MNGIRWGLKSCGIVSPLKLRSDCDKNVPTTDGRKIIANKFKDATNSIWREKVSAVDALLKEVIALPVGGIADGFNKMNAIQKANFLFGIAIDTTGPIISFLGYSLYEKSQNVNHLAFVGVGAFCFLGSSYTMKNELTYVYSAIKDRISIIDSDFIELKEDIKLREGKLKEGQRDFKSLLVSSQDKLCPDMMGVIGQDIFDASIKET